jgi:HAD superfamily hydrolase (TIGR01450 family)
VTEAATTAGQAATTLPRGSARPLSETYDAALLDLDGVVYLGGAPIPGAAAALSEARAAGMRLAFVTNNASRSPSAIAAQLAGLGVPARPADIVTSAQAAAHLIADRLPRGAAVLVAGGIGLRLALRERGLRPVSVAADRPAAVVQGYAPDMSYSLLAEAAVAIRAGAWYVASNADATLPTPRGPQPGNGALVQVLVTATGQQPVVAGKPELPLHAEAVARTGARHPLVVGDRLDTDIEGAVRGGADSLLVLTGVCQPADVVRAAPGARPSYLASDLSGLLESHPAVTAADGAFGCGGWTARLDAGGGRLDLSGDGDAIDGLRALCAASWAGWPARPADASPDGRSGQESPAGPVPAGPVPAGPVPAGPVPAGPDPAGPDPAGPDPAGPVTAEMARDAVGRLGFRG